MTDADITKLIGRYAALYPLEAEGRHFPFGRICYSLKRKKAPGPHKLMWVRGVVCKKWRLAPNRKLRAEVLQRCLAGA